MLTVRQWIYRVYEARKADNFEISSLSLLRRDGEGEIVLLGWGNDEVRVRLEATLHSAVFQT